VERSPISRKPCLEGCCGKRVHEKHDDGGKKRGSDDAAEEKSAAVDLTIAAAKEIDGRNRDGRAEESSERSDEPGDFRRQGQMTLDDEGNDRADSGAGGDSQDIRIGKRIAQERLKACARHRKGCSDDDSEQDTRQADVHDDHAVVGGNGTALAEEHAKESRPRP